MLSIMLSRVDDGALLGTVNGYSNVQSVEQPVCGIDVSSWEGDIDWDEVKASGVEYVMIKSNYGWTGMDIRFRQNIEGAKAAGLKVGVYLYSYATNTNEAQWEFNNLIATIGDYSLDLPVAYSLEDSCQRNMSVGELTDIAVAFCELVKSSGYTPMIRASSAWLRDKLDYSSISAYDLWIVQPNVDSCDYPYRNPPDVWQYSAAGTVSGIDGNVNMNYFYKQY